MELIFCFKLSKKYYGIFWWIYWTNLNISGLRFSNFVYFMPLEFIQKCWDGYGPEMVMDACIDSLHLPHTESTQSDTPCQLSQCLVRLYVDWVNAEWDSTPTESMRNAQLFTRISLLRDDPVDVEYHSALTRQHGISLSVDSVDEEYALCRICARKMI